MQPTASPCSARRWRASKRDPGGGRCVEHRDQRLGFVEATELNQRLRGGSSFTFAFDDGALRTSPGSQPFADCTLLCDPRAFLMTCYGRIPLWRSVKAGDLLCWGRKPWLGLRFTSLLLNP